MPSGKQSSTTGGSKGKQPSLPRQDQTKPPLQPSNGATATSSQSSSSTMIVRGPARLGYRSMPYPKVAPPAQSLSAPPRQFQGTLEYTVDIFNALPDANVVITVALTHTAYKCNSGSLKLFLPGLVDIYKADRCSVSPEGLPVFVVKLKDRVVYPLLLLAHGLSVPPSCVDDRDHLFEIIKLGLRRGSSELELKLEELSDTFVSHLDDPASLDISAGFVDSTRWKLGKQLVGRATLRLKQEDMKSLAASSRFFCTQGPLGQFRTLAIDDLAALMYINGGLHIPFLTCLDFVWFRCSHGRRKTIFVGLSAVKVDCAEWFYNYCSALIDALSKRPTHQTLTEHTVELKHILPASRHCDQCQGALAKDILRFSRLFAAHVKERVQSLPVKWI
ncbi:hypothetical protein PsYK624_047860 [Phanerochaete sordida]|uniref:Uncharacterized protein n=1 Tax=Phanerochaete sordida TaxID=48140 RepID=A0A9P3G5L1_9APHY|nr:hypothetical protein PsYK624_047860 [Phanerochaete sordida]